MSQSTQTINEYLNKSDKLINHVEEIMEEDPEKAVALASEQLGNHIKLLRRVN